MKIVSDPYNFRAAGIFSMSEAVALTHLGRCGTLGCRMNDIANACDYPHSTAISVVDRLVEKGFVTRYSRSNRQGRAFHWCVTPAGWELLTREPVLRGFMDLSELKGGKHG